MSPRKQPEPWPWPADTALDRARRIAQAYRHALEQADPAGCDRLDRQSTTFGQGWVVPSRHSYEPDDLLTTELAADVMQVKIRTIYAWRAAGLPMVPTPDGPRYRFADLRGFAAARRLRTQKRGVSDA